MKKIISKLPRSIFTLLRGILACATLTGLLVLLPAMAFCEIVTLAWDANTESDLKGYTLYYGTASGNYTSIIDVGNNTEYTTPDLQDGLTYYFAVTAYNDADHESGYSVELPYTVSSPNKNPTTPTIPNSPSSGYVDTSYTFNTSASDPDGDPLEFQFDWGDGSNSSWGAAARSHAWSAAGTYCIKALVRDSHEALSGWSDCHNITIANEVVVDSDGDGVPDDQDDFPYDADEYLDTDGDGEGNNADTDDDNDGMPDDWELLYGLNPLIDDAADDPDGDDISNINEFDLGTAPDHFEGNFKPDTPALLAPENSATVSLTPQFETGDFDDPNANDVHSKTRWVIIRAFDGVCVFDVTSTASLTSLTLPNQILEEDTEYIWQARFIDNHDSPSDWSAQREFISGLADHDTDKNGVPDVQEVSETQDLDADGTVDVDQTDIKCANVLYDNNEVQICISIKNAENAESILSLAVEDPADPELNSATEGKPNYFEFGLLDFKMLVTNPGDETTVTIYLSQPAFAEGNCFKYDPVDGIWLDYSGYTDFSPNRKEVYLTLKDGGFGDADGIENGIIVDPLAFGSESDPSGGSDGSPLDDIVDGIIPNDLSCFISTAAAGSDNRLARALRQEIRGCELSIIFVVILVGFLAKVVFSGVRRKS